MTGLTSTQNRLLRWRPARTLQALTGALLLGLLALAFVAQSNDFDNYAEYFDLLRSDGWAGALGQRFEPVFALLSLPLSQGLASNAATMAVLAGLAILLKWIALSRLCPTRLAFALCGLFYLVRFGPLHELTQIRIALALSLWLLALGLTHKRSFWLLLLLFPLTHFSTIVLVPLTLAWRLLRRDPQRYLRLERRAWIGVLLAVVGIGVTLNLLIGPLALLFAIVEVYSGLGFGEEPVNLLGLAPLVDMLFLATAMLLRAATPAQRFWLWMQAVSLASFIAFRDFPVFAHRMHEMLNLSWLLYLTTALSHPGLRGLHARLFCGVCIALYVYLHAFSHNAIVSL